jgi:signal transduction histidine kinase
MENYQDQLDKEAEIKKLRQELEAALALIELQNQQIETKERDNRAMQSNFMQLQEMFKQSEQGWLISNLVHEINTPLAAIKGSVQNLKSSDNVTQLRLIPVYFNQLGQDARHIFWEILTLQFSGDAPAYLQANEERKAIKELVNQLNEMQILEPEDYAEKIVKLGLYHNRHLLWPLFQDKDACFAFFNLMQVILPPLKRINTISSAIDRAQKTTKTIRSLMHSSVAEKKQPINLLDNIKSILFLFDELINDGLSIYIENPESFLPIVEADPDELTHIWQNIITNAAHATSGKGMIRIYFTKNEDSITISIKDNGPGIPENIQSKIFQPYFTTKAQDKGTGVGLALCKEIIEKHKGEISVSSHEGETIFHIKLPLKQ